MDEAGRRREARAPIAAAQGSDRRQRYPVASGPGARTLLRVLMAHDGSTTRLCEAIAGAPVQVRLLSQRTTCDVPSRVRELLTGERFIERITALTARGEVLTDNLVYVALEGLDRRLCEELAVGARPIGHLLDGQWQRRDIVDVGRDVLCRLWDAVGEPDPAAMRNYCLRTPGGVQMLVCETFRAGLWHAAEAARHHAAPHREALA